MFLPIGDDQEHERTPWANRALLAANALAFVAFCLPRPGERLVWDFALNPSELRPLQFLTHLFLHADLFHVAGNLLFLWTFGRLVEERLGAAGYLALYLLSGLGSAGLHLLAESNPAPALGASGAVAGMIGACLVFCPRAHVKVLYWFFFVGVALVPLSLWALLWVAAQVLFAALDRGATAYWGHLGGFAAGFGAAWILREAAARRLKPRAPPLEPRETRRPFQAGEEEELAFLDESVDAFALVLLDAPRDGQPRSGVLARRIPRKEADARVAALGAPAALIADQAANAPPEPRAVESVSWDERQVRVRIGAEMRVLPWSAPALWVDVELAGERFLDILVSRGVAYRVPERPGVALTRVDPARRQEESARLADLIAAAGRSATLAGGRFESAAELEDYVFRAWHLARAGRPVSRLG